MHGYYSVNTISDINIDLIRLWKLDNQYQLKEAFDYVKKTCNEHRTFDYKIEMKGIYLEKDLSCTVGMMGFGNEDIIVVDSREEAKPWNFVQTGVENLEKCDFCHKFGKMPISCKCKEVFYCSEECRLKDLRFHSMRCDLAGEDDENEEDFTKKENAKMGLTGLTNLGNTCFMNSALQCLSNTYSMTEYFLQKKFLNEINENNPLGSKGKLAKKFASLLKNLWFESSNIFSPYGIKMAVAKLNPIHDSSEFLSYILDGLHEDLNKVLKKPMTSQIECNGENDYLGARISWLNHIKRNRSIIVDLMHGQFKSKLVCPDCSKISITFDPFLLLSLPIPSKKVKQIHLTFIFADNKLKPKKLSIKFTPEKSTVKELKSEIGKVLEKEPQTFFFAFLNYSYLTKKISDEDFVSTLRKRTKHQDLYALEYSEKSIETIKNDNYLEVPIQMTQETKLYANSNFVKRPFTFVRPFYFSKNYPTKEIHYDIAEYFRFLFEEFAEEEFKSEVPKMTTQELYEKFVGNNENSPYNVLVVTNSRGYFNCYFCGLKDCKNCPLPFDNEVLLKDLLDKIESQYHDFEIEVFWKNPGKIELSRLNIDKEEGNNITEEKKAKPTIDITTCLELFREPEKLGETEAWYCNACKDHKQATKQMQIYSAPRFLIVHFKRFKTSVNYQYSMMSSGKITDKIIFPHKLDLTKFILNKNLPQSFEEGITFDENGVVTEDTSQKIETENDKKTENNDKEEIIEEKETKVEPKEENEKKIEKEENEKKIEEEITPEEETDSGNKIFYELYAVSNHFGNVGFGHYTAYAKNALDEKWYTFDDSHVSEVSPEQVVSDSAYLLFYKRC